MKQEGETRTKDTIKTLINKRKWSNRGGESSKWYAKEECKENNAPFPPKISACASSLCFLDKKKKKSKKIRSEVIKISICNLNQLSPNEMMK